jgi:sulfate/thiosulfate transport system permease protein
MIARYGLRTLALGYLTMLLFVPVALIASRTFENGVGPVWDAITQPNALHALRLTLTVAVIAVVANTVFGILAAMLLVRREFRGKSLMNAVIDLPFAVSPVVVGLALILVYGQDGWLGSWFVAQGMPIIFSFPGIVIATIFVSLPFVVREVAPVLREIGTEQEQAAATLGAGPFHTFFRVTLPAIRWGVVYGVVLTTARAIGEYGAIAVVSGKILGRTETLTLYVENRYLNFDTEGAYAIALLLAGIALATLFAMNLFKPRKEI